MEFTRVLLYWYLLGVAHARHRCIQDRILDYWIGCYEESGVRSGKSRFRSEAKLCGRQAGIHQDNTSFVLIVHIPGPPLDLLFTTIARAPATHQVELTRSKLDHPSKNLRSVL